MPVTPSLEGRDIGSVVCPDAEVKVWLVADPVERARRRGAERPETSADETLTGLRLRDELDAGQMRRAPDARDRRLDAASTSTTSSRASAPWSTARARSMSDSARARGPLSRSSTGRSARASSARLTHTIARLKTYGARARAARGRRRAGVQPLRATWIRRRSARPARGASSTWRRSRAHDTPGLGPLIRSHGTLALRRGRVRPGGAAPHARDGAARTSCSECSSRGRGSAAACPGRRSRERRWSRSRRAFPIVPAAVYGSLGVELELQAGVGRVRRADALRDLRAKLGRLSRGDRARSWSRSSGSGRSWFDMHELGTAGTALPPARSYVPSRAPV